MKTTKRKENSLFSHLIERCGH